MERETITITTPVDKKVIILKEWITGGERRKISNVLLEGSSIKSANLQDMEISADAVNKVQDVTFEEVIMSIDGSTEDIVKKALGFKVTDFDFLVAEINKITGDADEVKKN